MAKTVPLLNAGNFKAVDIVQQVVGVNPNGMDIAEIRARVRILRAVEAAKDGMLTLEDADFAKLKAVFETNKTFVVADPDLETVLDALLDYHP